MTLRLLGLLEQSLDAQDDYHRNYRAKWLVETDDTRDGPFTAAHCPGLPTVGSVWSLGNDFDGAAFCWPNWSVSAFNSSSHEPNTLWVVEQPFTTKFNMSAMQFPENPFAAPPEISGTFVKFQEEKKYDFEGKPMHTMSFEPFRGKMAEFDDNRPTVSISMNYPSLGLDVFAFMIDYVNDAPMWGLPARCVKLSNVRWSRSVYRFGYFYTRHYDFDINFRTFDRVVPEVGTKKLAIPVGQKNNPEHWILRRDLERNILRNEFYYTVDGHDWDGISPETIAKRTLKYYPQTNLLSLGIPASF